MHPKHQGSRVLEGSRVGELKRQSMIKLSFKVKVLGRKSKYKGSRVLEGIKR